MVIRIHQSTLFRTLLLALGILINTATFSRDKPDTYRVPIKGEGFSAVVEAYVSPCEIKVDDDKTYYWLKSKVVHTSVGGYSGLLLHGAYVSHYPDGSLKEKGRFKNGLKVGDWKEWHPNGLVKEVTSYKNGKLNGKALRYDENGQLSLSGRYRDGARHGKFQIYQSGEQKSTEIYSKGKKKAKKEKQKKDKKLFRKRPKKTKTENTEEEESPNKDESDENKSSKI